MNPPRVSSIRGGDNRSRWASLAAGALLLMMAAVPEAGAERFLTLSEAQALLFPGADRFEGHKVFFTKEETKALKRHLESGIPNRGNRVWLAYAGQAYLGMLVVDHVIGKHEFIDYAVALNPEGTVQTVEIMEYRESHGGEIRDPKWRVQFQGKKKGDSFRLHEEIHNISGATMSCRSVTEGVRRVVASHELVFRPRLLAGAGLSQPGRGTLGD